MRRMETRPRTRALEALLYAMALAVAMAAAVSAFGQADAMARRAEAVDTATMLAQSAAESVAANRGDVVAAMRQDRSVQACHELSGTYVVYYDYDWTSIQSSNGDGYRLYVSPLPGGSVGSAEIAVVDTGSSDPELIRLTATWQVPLETEVPHASA